MHHLRSISPPTMPFPTMIFRAKILVDGTNGVFIMTSTLDSSIHTRENAWCKEGNEFFPRTRLLTKSNSKFRPTRNSNTHSCSSKLASLAAFATADKCQVPYIILPGYYDMKSHREIHTCKVDILFFFFFEKKKGHFKPLKLHLLVINSSLETTELT